MAEFTIISDTSKTILRMLKDKLCENNEPIESDAGIMLVAPNDTNADYQLGLHLYDIKEVGEYRRSTPLLDGNIRTQPPKLLELHYMLFSNPRSQTRIDAEKEQSIFGRALQVLYDAGIISLAESNIFFTPGEESVSVSVLNQSFEDKVKIWSAFQSPYRLCICFVVSPVTLSSRRSTTVTRVTEVTFETKQNPPTLPIDKE